MALGGRPSIEREDSTSVVVGSEGNAVEQDSDTNRFAVTPVVRGEGNIPISDHDLVADGDFVIPDDTSLSGAPFIGGGAATVLGVESNDDNQFSVTIEYGELDSNENFIQRFEYGPDKNSSLDADSYYIIRVSTVLDRVRVTFSDTSGAGQNNIQGGFNAH